MLVSLLKSCFETRQVSSKSWVSHQVTCVLIPLPSLSSWAQTLGVSQFPPSLRDLQCSHTFLPWLPLMLWKCP